MCIASLGYVGFRVSDPAAWTRFATEILGLTAVTSPSGAQRFRADSLAWRIALEEGSEDDISLAGFEVTDAAALSAVRERLVAAGIAVSDADAGLLKERGVLGLISCRDPMGLTIEVYYGPTEVGEQPFVSSAGVRGFVTGEQGLGHIVLSAPDIAPVRAFYLDLLGFKLSDIIRMQLSPDFALDLEFYHCNRRHHTLALAPVPSPKRLHHFMLQTRRLDDVGFALDRAHATGVTITQSLGRHTNDQMVSFYAATPSGFEVEYGWGALEVHSDWRVGLHSKVSSWGHKPPPSAG